MEVLLQVNNGSIPFFAWGDSVMNGNTNTNWLIGKDGDPFHCKIVGELSDVQDQPPSIHFESNNLCLSKLKPSIPTPSPKSR
jgi:hypothetical protein